LGTARDYKSLPYTRMGEVVIGTRPRVAGVPSALHPILVCRGAIYNPAVAHTNAAGSITRDRTFCAECFVLECTYPIFIGTSTL
jgi:hypothetical protein